MIETSTAPRTRAVAKFWRPIPGQAQYSRAQRLCRALFGRAPRPRVRPDGSLVGFELATERVMENLVLTAGKNDLLDKYLSGSAYTAAWFAGLISSVSYSAIAAADTAASHAGWTEAGATNAPNYTGNRPAITFAAASGGVKASSSIPTVTFTNSGTVKGLFLSTIVTKDTTTGLIYSAGLFTAGDAPVANGYVMTLTYSATQT